MEHPLFQRTVIQLTLCVQGVGINQKFQMTTEQVSKVA